MKQLPTVFGLEAVLGMIRYPFPPLLAPLVARERSRCLPPSVLGAARERTKRPPLFAPPAGRETTRPLQKEDGRRWILPDLKTAIWYPRL
jgi:hypothetical protein